MHDFGIMGMTEPQLEPERCISCGACVKKCQTKSVGALTLHNFRPVRDAQKCIGYIVDRTGFEEFKRWALKDVTLPEKAEVMSPMYWKGIKY